MANKYFILVIIMINFDRVYVLYSLSYIKQGQNLSI